MSETHHHHNHDHRTTSHGQTKRYWLEDFLAHLRMQHVIRSIPERSIVCDMGCGYRGRFLFTYQDRFTKAYGFDIAVDTQLSNDRVTLQPANVNQHIPLPDNAMDVVTSLAVLEHLSDRQQHLREVYRILKPNGRLLLTTPTPANKPLLELLAFRLHVTDATEISDHKCYMSDQDLRDLLAQAGFKQEKIKTSTWQLGLNNFVFALK